jgi:hypothetical protein
MMFCFSCDIRSKRNAALNNSSAHAGFTSGVRPLVPVCLKIGSIATRPDTGVAFACWDGITRFDPRRLSNAIASRWVSPDSTGHARCGEHHAHK